MIVYWSMFSFAAAYALLVGRRMGSSAQGMQSARINVAWLIVLLLLTLLIGYRFKVGGDWGNYLANLQLMRYQSLHSALQKGDPAYQLVSLLAINLDWGISGVNVICAFLFSTGLVYFCRGLPRPWLALAVAMPYMVIVVAMGYSRQGVALGLAMLGLVALTRKANVWFVFWVLMAAAFHKSAVLLLPIAGLAASHNRYWTMLWVAVVTLLAYVLFVQDSVQALYTNYIEAQYQSEGAFLRGAMNLVPACIYLMLGRRFHLQTSEIRLWRWFSIISIVFFMGAVTLPVTTAVDRMALYMLPLQLVVFSYLPDVLGKPGGRNTGLTGMVLLYYATVQFVWLNYAMHARGWLPYRFYPLEAWL